MRFALRLLPAGRHRRACTGVSHGISTRSVPVYSSPAVPLLRKILRRRSRGVLLKLSLGDPLDQTSLLFRMRQSLYLWGDPEPSLRRLYDAQKIFYNGQGLGSL
jgi:hypothetical protein